MSEVQFDDETPVQFDDETPFETEQTEMPEGSLVISGTITPPEEGEEGETYPLVSLCESPGFSHWLEALQAGKRKPLLAKRWLTAELIARYKGGGWNYTIGFTGQGGIKAAVKPVHLGAMEGPVDFHIAFDGEEIHYAVGNATGSARTFLTAEAGDDMVVMLGFPAGTKAENKPPVGFTVTYAIDTE